MGQVFINGSLVSEKEAAVPVGDHGFLYGDGLFETIAVFRGKPVFLDEHLARLESAAEFMQLSIATEPYPWQQAIREVLAANGVNEGYLRLVLTRGVGPRSWEPQGYGSPNVVIYAARGRPYPPQEYERGWQAIVSSYRQDQLSPLCRLKTLNFLPHVLARREAKARGADEALHLNLLGQLTEGAMTNVFLAYKGKLITPDVASGLLPGITRATVLALAVQGDISVVERPVGLEELQLAEEAFLTSSLLGIMPLVALDGQPIGCGRPGSVTQQLQQAYQKMLEDWEATSAP